jgi:hypothetical protein
MLHKSYVGRRVRLAVRRLAEGYFPIRTPDVLECDHEERLSDFIPVCDRPGALRPGLVDADQSAARANHLRHGFDVAAEKQLDAGQR